MNLSIRRTYVPNLKRIRSVCSCSLGWLGCKSASSTFSWSHRSSIHLLHVWWCLWCQAIPQVDWQHAIWRWVAAFLKDMLRIETGLYVSMRLHIEWSHNSRCNCQAGNTKLGPCAFLMASRRWRSTSRCNTPKFPDPKQHQKLVTLIDSSDTFPLLTYQRCVKMIKQSSNLAIVHLTKACTATPNKAAAPKTYRI